MYKIDCMCHFISRRYFLYAGLLVIPMMLFIFTHTLFSEWRPFYRVGPDPVFYDYLLNGLNLAGGYMEIGHTQHPGTPVQCFIATVIFIKHLFNYGTPVYQDVLLRPESYLYTICLSIAAMFAIVTWMTGIYVYKHTGSLALSILFQLTPLLYNNYKIGTNPVPESFIMIAGIFFMGYIYCNFISPPPHSTDNTALKRIIICGAFASFLVACKFTCAIFLFFIIMLVPKKKERYAFLDAFILFLFIFLIPALSKLNIILTWIYALIIYTGSNGDGIAGVINSSEFYTHLCDIFKANIFFTFLYCILTVSLALIWFKRDKFKAGNKIYALLVSGLWISISLLILLVARCYSIHYLIPAEVCFPLIIIGAYKVYEISSGKNLIPYFQHSKKKQTALFFLPAFLLVSIDSEKYWNCHPAPLPESTNEFLNKNSSLPLIFTYDGACSRIEPYFNYGIAYCGALKYKYQDFLKNIYPNSYLFFNIRDNMNIQENCINYWGNIFIVPELFSLHPRILVFTKNLKNEEKDTLLNHLCKWGNNMIATGKMVNSDPKTGETIYELEKIGNTADSLMLTHRDITFDLRKLTADKLYFLSSDGNDSVEVHGELNTMELHSGDNSVCLNHRDKWGLQALIKAYPGNYIIVKVWKKTSDVFENGDIAFLSKQQNSFFYESEQVVDSGENEWKQIEYKCLIPSTVKDSSVRFFVYYSGNSKAYFSDLSIRIYSMKLNQTSL